MNQLIKCILILTLFTLSEIGLGQEISSIKDSLRINGSIGTRLIGYNISGFENRRAPFSYILNGDVTISKGEFSIPLSFTYSEQDRTFHQPFNQFGIAPTYKWVKVYAGYNNISWSNYSMNGHQILGGGLELTPKKWRIGFMYGRLRRESEIDSFNLNRNPPSFQRNGFTAKIGYGTEETYVDLIFLKAWEKPNALHQNIDSTANHQPGNNTVIALKSKVKILKNLHWYLDGAVSGWNRNVNAFEVPKENLGAYSPFSFIFQPTASSHFYNAIESGFQTSVKGHNFNLGFKRVDPDYQSMGSYFIENDIKSILFNHAFSLFEGKASFYYGLERYIDNIQNKKEFTTVRYQPMANISITPSYKWGATLGWTDMFTQQEDGTVQLTDTIRMSQRNPGIQLNPYYNIMDTSKSHSFMGNYTNMRLIDFNRFTSGFSQYRTQMFGINYSLGWITKQASLSFGLNQTSNKTENFNESGFGGTLSANKSWKEGKTSANTGLNTYHSDVNSSFAINAAFLQQLPHQQNVSLNLNYLINKARTNVGRDYNELTIIISYHKHF